MKTWLRKLLARKSSPTRHPEARRFSPQLERMEERLVPTTFAQNVNPGVPLATTLLTVTDPIQIEYAATANETTADGKVVQNALGAPTSGETDVPWVPGARMETYQSGAIYWSGSPSDSAHVIYGTIGAKYDSLGDAGGTRVLLPEGPVGNVPTGFHWVTLAPGYGLPTSDEADVPGVPGVRVSYFQNGGAIYWSGAHGAFEVHGAIGAEYTATAGETTALGDNLQKILGAPTSDEMDVPGAPGDRMNTFDGGTIYWSPAPNTNGAHAVYGAIGAKYASLGGPAGFLGSPISEEQEHIPGLREQDFQNGKILSITQGTLAIQNSPSMMFNSGYIGFTDSTPVGGSLQLTVSQDGSFEIKGSFRDSGFCPESVKGIIQLVSPSGRIWTQTFSTSMAGTIGSGSNVGSVDVQNTDSTLADNWADFQGSMMHTTTTVGLDWGSVWDVVEPYAEAVGAALLTWLGGKAKDNSSGNSAENTVGGTGVADNNGVSNPGADGLSVEAFTPGVTPAPLPPANLTAVATALTTSAESYGDFIANAYQQYLGRAPETAGLNWWIANMQHGMSDEQVEAGFIGSLEYIQDHGGAGAGWVTGMYQNLLARTPAQTEVNYWLQQMSQGMSATAVAYGFAASAEREGDRVAADYQKYLGRAASVAEINYWVSDFETGASNEDVIAGFVGSPEYFQSHGGNATQWLDAVYQDIFGRSADANADAYWLPLLQAG